MSIDIIVPTVTGRESSLERCLESFPGFNHIVVKDLPTCGAAWVEGIKRSSADHMLLCADDIEAHPDLDLAVCVEAVEDGYLPAPIVYRPNGSIESAGGDMGAPGCLLTDVQPDWTPVDFTPMPFWSREQARKIRMIPAHYMTDVWASHRGRQLGYETVLRHDYRLIHHHEMVGRRFDTGGDHQIYDEAMSNAES
jgi:hypothetical protein